MSPFVRNVRLLLALTGFFIVVHLVNVFGGYWLLQLGLLPRNPIGLPGIVIAPFLHGSFYHLMSNVGGILLFGGLCLLRSRKFFIQASVFIVLCSGFLVWLLGRPAVHIGASGWVFGLWSLCVAMAWVDRRPITIIIAILVIIFYGGMIYGVLPRDPRISFEFHLFGAIAGVLFALTENPRRR